jgi:hypothetical protein
MTPLNKNRKPPRWGVSRCFEAYCRVCQWHGSVYSGKGGMREANCELKQHRATARCGYVK